MSTEDINIYSTFYPGQQIEDPKHFAGRKSDIEQALKSLCSPGSSIVVYGERGVGKSSFVEMIKLIAKGESHLLYKHKFHKIFPPEQFKYKIISIECDSEANTTEKVLQRLITSPYGIKGIISSRIEKIETSTKDKYTVDLLKIFKFGSDENSKITSTEFKEENIFELFTNLILTISKNLLNQGEGLLIAIDEFDLVEDSSKMASLIKTLSKNNIKFLISGIAESYESLIQGHISITRQLLYGRINILPMKKEEIEDLFSLVEESSNKKIRFDKSFISEVIDKSSGFPHYVQLFGQLALEDYVREKKFQTPMLIHKQHLCNGIKKLASFETQMESDYLNIIKENPLKEYIIKTIAKSKSKKISDDEICNLCHKAGVIQPKPKNAISNLLSHREPQFLLREKEGSQYVFFANPLFKIFVHSREPELIKNEDGQFMIQ